MRRGAGIKEKWGSGSRVEIRSVVISQSRVVLPANSFGGEVYASDIRESCQHVQTNAVEATLVTFETVLPRVTTVERLLLGKITRRI